MGATTSLANTTSNKTKVALNWSTNNIGKNSAHDRPREALQMAGLKANEA